MRLQVDWSLIPVPVTSPLTVAGITHLVRKMMPTDILDPEERLMCLGCSCGWVAAEIHPPGLDCVDPLCECHTAFWDTVPELEKRALWGDK